MLRQVACEEHEVRLVADAPERLAHAVTVSRAGMDVALRATRILVDMCTSLPRDWRMHSAGTGHAHLRDDQFERILAAMKVAAAALRDGGIPFPLAGGLAVYAAAAQPTDHDVDFLIAKRTPTARSRLADAGFAPSGRPKAGSTRSSTRTSR